LLSIDLKMRRGAFALDVAFDAPTPGVVALFGASGSGKTTVIDLCAGLLRPAAGRIELDGEVLFDAGRIDVATERRAIGYVFQDARLFPHRSVAGNLRYGERRARARAPTAQRSRRSSSCSDSARCSRRRPHQLSGGERQRVAIGRALLARPRLLLLDEPLAGVDRARRQEVLPLSRAAARPVPDSDRIREPSVRRGAAARDPRGVDRPAGASRAGRRRGGESRSGAARAARRRAAGRVVEATRRSASMRRASRR
jgi:ABC-type molybdate transport system ATPase subunit